MIRVVIAEDHQALIDGLKSFVEYRDDIKIVGYTNNGSNLLELISKKKPNVILCDIRMPVVDGITITKSIVKEFPDVKVVAFTMFDQADAIKKMLEAGAVGYVLKNSSLKTVLEAIKVVADGKTYYDEKIHLPTKKNSNKKRGLLSVREKEILELIGLGKTSHQIADQLFIGKTTVDSHRKNMIRKLNIDGAGELLRYAIEKKYDFD